MSLMCLHESFVEVFLKQIYKRTTKDLTIFSARKQSLNTKKKH